MCPPWIEAHTRVRHYREGFSNFYERNLVLTAAPAKKRLELTGGSGGEIPFLW
jgi:hypothetical protein